MHEIKIGHVLKRIMKEQGKSLKEVSYGAGIPYTTLHTWRENRQPKNILQAKKLADFLNITLHELLFDLPDKKTGKETFQIPRQGTDEFFTGTFQIIVKRID